MKKNCLYISGYLLEIIESSELNFLSPNVATRNLAVQLNHSCEGEILWPGSGPAGKSISACISA
jgi:hypothetical protein